MPKAVIMPRLDIDMEKGSVVEWRKREGERVEAGEVVAVVMSEKVTYEVESPVSGVLAKVLVEPEVEVPIGTPIAVVAEEGDTREEVEEAVREAEEELKKALGLALRAPAPAPRPALALEVRRPEGARRVKITPVARKLAEQYGIDITKIRGTGPGGRITKRDVLRALEELKAKPAYREVRLTGIRRLTAEKMVAAWEAPHASLTVEVDMEAVEALRERVEAEEGVKVPYDAIFVRAVALALRKHPELNATFEGGVVKLHKAINVCFAVDTPRGLITPVVKNADEKSLAQVAREIRELAEKARSGLLSMDDVKGGTFTITNLGVFGIDLFTPIVNHPQVAILAFGRVAERPVVEDGSITVKRTAWLTLSFDHRAVDGGPAARFLRTLKELLEEPSALRG